MSAPKTPVPTGRPNSRASAATSAVEPRLRDRGRRRRRPRRPVALARRCVERELADGEDGAAGVGDRAVHHAGVVGEDAQRDDLAREPVAVLVGVVGRDAGQDQQAGSDRGDGGAVDRDRGLAHPLDQCPHAAFIVAYRFTTLRLTSLTVPPENVIVVTVSGSPSAGRYDQRP